MAERQIFARQEMRNPSAPVECIADPVRAALQCVGRHILEGLTHGHFKYEISCELGNSGRRLLIIHAGMSYKFTISETDVLNSETK